MCKFREKIRVQYEVVLIWGLNLTSVDSITISYVIFLGFRVFRCLIRIILNSTGAVGGAKKNIDYRDF